MAEALDKKVDQLDSSLRLLRKRLADQDNEHRRDLQGVRFGVAGSALAAAILTLTVTVWGMEHHRFGDEVLTLWSLVPEGWFGFVTLALVLLTGVGTIGAFAGAAVRAMHITMVVLSLLTAAAVLVVSSAVDVEDAVGAGRWCTLVVALALAMLHGIRAEDLHAARRTVAPRDQTASSRQRHSGAQAFHTGTRPPQ